MTYAENTSLDKSKEIAMIAIIISKDYFEDIKSHYRTNYFGAVEKIAELSQQFFDINQNTDWNNDQDQWEECIDLFVNNLLKTNP